MHDGEEHHPGGNSGANLKSISHRCRPILVAFVLELTKETIYLPLGSLQVGGRSGDRWLAVGEVGELDGGPVCDERERQGRHHGRDAVAEPELGVRHDRCAVGIALLPRQGSGFKVQGSEFRV